MKISLWKVGCDIICLSVDRKCFCCLGMVVEWFGIISRSSMSFVKFIIVVMIVSCESVS